MKDFYYQVKVKIKDEYDTYSYWSKPVMKGIVQAETSKQAREIVKTSILEREIKKGDDVLLSILEITPDKQYLADFFKPRVCKQCGRTFDNTISGFYSSEFCCENCYELYNYEHLDVSRYLQVREIDNISFYECNPVIYKITNLVNGKSYVGQTIRSFTLRWWEHYKAWIKYQPEGIQNFEFSVLEEFTKEEIKKNPNLLREREQYWIDFFDAYNNGYNSRDEVSKVNYQKKSVEEIVKNNEVCNVK